MIGNLVGSITFSKLLLKAFQIYFQWEDGGGPEKDQKLM